MICKAVKYRSSDTPHIGKILSILPERYTFAYGRLPENDKKSLSEIRIRSELPCSFTSMSGNIVMCDENGGMIRSHPEEIALIMQNACDGSVYSRTHEIKNGYISYCGTRIGLCGSGMNVDGEYTGQRCITSLSIRIPVYAPDAADSVFGYIRRKGICDSMGILAVSPPNLGKTTFLRAFAKGMSDTSPYGFSRRVCVIDERGELCGGMDFSSCLIDVISGVPKIKALEIAIRTLSPEIVVFDEIGNERETELLSSAFSGGVHIAASVHGSGISDIVYNKGIRSTFSKGVFRTVYLMKENAAKCPGEIIDMSERITD